MTYADKVHLLRLLLCGEIGTIPEKALPVFTEITARDLAERHLNTEKLRGEGGGARDGEPAGAFAAAWTACIGDRVQAVGNEALWDRPGVLER